MATIYYPTTAVVQQRQVSGSTLTEQFIGVLPDQILVFTGSTFFTSSLTASYAYTSSNAYTASYLVGGTRTMLTGNTTWYVHPTGSDSNNGLSLSTPFRTIQKGVDIASSVDTVIYNITLQLADGAHTGSVSIKPRVGAGTLTIQGNLANSSSVNWYSSGSFNNLICDAQTTSVIKNIRFTSTATAIYCRLGWTVDIYNSIFGACTNTHLVAFQGGIIKLVTDYEIDGPAVYHIQTFTSGIVACVTRNVKIKNTPAFSVFIWCYLGGIVQYSGNTFNGSATGARYDISGNGVVDTGGGGATYLPGNSAGAIATGGQYL